MWVLDNGEPHPYNVAEALAANGYRLRIYAELEELLAAGQPRTPACLLLGCQLRDGLTGLRVLTELQQRKWNLPTVFLAVRWNIQVVVSAIQAGADGFLAKPCDPEELVESVNHALHRSLSAKPGILSIAEARARVAALNSRELEIFRLLISGLLNKEIADRLNLALITVKVYRARCMKKLGVENPTDMAIIAQLCGITADTQGTRLLQS